MTHLYDLTQRHHNATGAPEVRRVLAPYGVKSYIHDCGQQDWQSLYNAMAWHWPIGVGIHGTHMLTLVDIGKDYVTVIDNSDSTLREQRWTIAYFRRVFDGLYVCLDPREQASH